MSHLREHRFEGPAMVAVSCAGFGAAMRVEHYQSSDTSAAEGAARVEEVLVVAVEVVAVGPVVMDVAVGPVDKTGEEGVAVVDVIAVENGPHFSATPSNRTNHS